MKTEIPFAPEKLEKISWNNFLYSDNTSDPKIRRMKKILHIALENELTQKQHECIIMRYMENLSVKDIAMKMHIKPTTVYKHLNKAVSALKKCTLYL